MSSTKVSPPGIQRFKKFGLELAVLRPVVPPDVPPLGYWHMAYESASRNLLLAVPILGHFF
jgi:hypothetical protein